MIGTEKVELEILSEVSGIANSTRGFDYKLDNIVRVIADKLGRHVCYVVLRDKDKDTLTLKAAVGLRPESIGRVMLKMGEGVTGWVAEHKEPVALEYATSDPRYKLIPMTGEESYKSMLSVPILFDNDCIGVMTVQTVEPHEYQPDEVTLLSTIANDVGGIINSARLYEEAKQNLEALSALYEVSRALVSTLDLQTLLDMLARLSAETVGAKGCILRLLNSETGLLEIKASYGLGQDAGRKTALKLGESIAGKVAAEGKPILVSDIYEHPDFLNATGAVVNSLVCVPLVAKDKVIGTLALYDKERPGKQGEVPFNEDDLHLLSTLATQASMAVENAFIYERAEDLAVQNEKNAQELAFLYYMANSMRSTLRLDRLLHIILTAMTMGGGMGFNRAMLFLVNERTKSLQGMLGVGPSSSWEAGEIWSRLAGRQLNLREWTVTDSEIAAQKEAPFNRMVKSMRVSYEDGADVFSATVRDKRAVYIEDADTDPLAGPEITSLIGANSFAVVPLVAKGRVISLVVVDNKFTGKPITHEDLQFLMMFSNQAGLAMESAMAYSTLEQANKDLKEAQDRLIQSEKMAALGEMAASIAHEIKNPLTVIGGFAGRLAKRQGEGDEGRYARIIRDEARRLEKILENVLDFSREKKPCFELYSFNAVCEETLSMYKDEFAEKNIRLMAALDPSVGDVQMDPRQIKQALINVLSNSEQAIGAKEGGGDLTVRTRLDAGQAVLEITDSGGGVSPEAIENIFNPFFTTKDKGTGLGLAITNKIIKNHGGEIEVVNKEGVGVTFIIRLPSRKDEPRTDSTCQPVASRPGGK